MSLGWTSISYRTHRAFNMKETHGKLDLLKIRNSFYQEIPQRMKDKPQNENLYLQCIYPTPESDPEYVKNPYNVRK